MKDIISRKEELRILERFFSSDRPEFLAIHGRRRVGKTFLIRRFFEKKNVIFFNSTGVKNEKLSIQISNFTKQIGKVFYGGASLKTGKNWNETFEILTKAIEKTPKSKKVVLFFDEFPWMTTKNSKLLQQLDYYWNQYWSNNNKIKLIICGSSAAWIIDKIVNNKGGLHNRLTYNIHLDPFNLEETRDFLNYLGIKLNEHQILQIYMTTGGVPFYLSKIERGLSATQNIERLAFTKKAFLLQEFDNLFSSLFEDHETHIEIIRTIATNRYGINQAELFRKIGKALQGKGGLKKLKLLEDSNFITSFKPLYHEKKGIYYKIIDEYTLFYIYWIEPIKDTLMKRGLPFGYWEKIKTSPKWYSFAGLAFEAICYKHIHQINQALHLGPTALASAWRYVPKKKLVDKGAQIDLLFDRDDDAITICEIKYTNSAFALTKEEAKNLKRKLSIFREQTRTKKQLFLSIISANGVKENSYSDDLVDATVTLDDLFK